VLNTGTSKPLHSEVKTIAEIPPYEQ